MQNIASKKVQLKTRPYLYAIHGPEFGPHCHDASLEEQRHTTALLHSPCQGTQVTLKAKVGKETASHVLKTTTDAGAEWPDVLRSSLDTLRGRLNGHCCLLLLYCHDEEQSARIKRGNG